MDQNMNNADMKFCKECGQKILRKAVVCPHCGCQVEVMEQAQSAVAPQIVINNTNDNNNANANTAASDPRMCKRSKWVALLLCIFLGFVGAHKFYEGRKGMGVLYLLTVGLMGIGWIVDIITYLFKPNPYYVPYR